MKDILEEGRKLEDICTCLDSLAALLSLGYKLVGLRVVHLGKNKCDYESDDHDDDDDDDDDDTDDDDAI